tara:strand:- start:1222 stop:2007 length:786 start_codon:yes stop_codon:yes gene_type:complete
MEIITANLIGPTCGNTSLGNELFVCATALALGWDHSDRNTIFKRNAPQPHHKSTILRNLPYGDVPLEKDLYLYNEPTFTFTPIPIKNNICLQGNFQSYKYFEKYEKSIQILMEVPLADKLKYLRDINPYNKILGAIHVRRGDYLALDEHHPVLSIDYYKKAIELMPEVEHWVICSDDIDWCKDNFNFLPSKYFSEGRKDYEDMWIMSLAKYHIIANSTFSWWSAFLSQEKNKKVIYPSTWFGPAKTDHNTCDLFPTNWSKL